VFEAVYSKFFVDMHSAIYILLEFHAHKYSKNASVHILFKFLNLAIQNRMHSGSDIFH
jgi:hypothetical protein